mmetsp:Transcript_57893/g.181828  ORF Transcript_57893/g.181828 Transcript_57893/m.181828 type:complete len:255 (-) Transcript_57893:358-1122(-)
MQHDGCSLPLHPDKVALGHAVHPVEGLVEGTALGAEDVCQSLNALQLHVLQVLLQLQLLGPLAVRGHQRLLRGGLPAGAHGLRLLLVRVLQDGLQPGQTRTHHNEVVATLGPVAIHCRRGSDEPANILQQPGTAATREPVLKARPAGAGLLRLVDLVVEVITPGLKRDLACARRVHGREDLRRSDTDEGVVQGEEPQARVPLEHVDPAPRHCVEPAEGAVQSTVPFEQELPQLRVRRARDLRAGVARRHRLRGG